MEPVDGMRDLGAKNVFYVPFGYHMDIEEYSQDTKGIAKTGISIEDWQETGADRINKSISIAKLFPDTTDRLIFDDFFNEPSHCGGWTEYSIDNIKATREHLHRSGYELWVVLYQGQIEKYDNSRLKEYLDEFDGVSFWFWNEPSVKQYLSFTSKFFNLTEGKKWMIGCYLWNFGPAVDANPKLVRYQLDSNLALIRAGDIEGIILHNNSLGAFNMPAYKEAKDWVAAHGDEEV